MKKISIMANWLNEKQKEEGSARLRCMCGFHRYKWNWRKLCRVCVACGKHKGLYNDFEQAIPFITKIISLADCRMP